jgi:type II secretory pathway pseudopilin PulG
MMLNKKRAKRETGFSLAEVLASLLVLTLSAVAITTAWRLADYQEMLTRVDRRAERILRQYYELQTFAPVDSRPFVLNDSSLSDSSSKAGQGAITGYLYHPRLISSKSGSARFGNLIPFSITMTTGPNPGASQLVLIYTIPNYGSQAPRQVTKTAVLNP